MGTFVVAIMAGFSFGYCIMDIIEKRRSEARIEEFIKEFNKD